jgi:hypothetical protein
MKGKGKGKGKGKAKPKTKHMEKSEKGETTIRAQTPARKMALTPRETNLEYTCDKCGGVFATLFELDHHDKTDH